MFAPPVVGLFSRFAPDDDVVVIEAHLGVLLPLVLAALALLEEREPRRELERRRAAPVGRRQQLLDGLAEFER